MSLDGRLPTEMRRNYRNVFDAWFRIIKEEGILTLWRGATPSMGVTGLTIAVQSTRSAYDIIKTNEYAKPMLYNGYVNEIGRIAIPGIFSTIVSLPFDMAKTR